METVWLLYVNQEMIPPPGMRTQRACACANRAMAISFQNRFVHFYGKIYILSNYDSPFIKMAFDCCLANNIITNSCQVLKRRWEDIDCIYVIVFTCLWILTDTQNTKRGHLFIMMKKILRERMWRHWRNVLLGQSSFGWAWQDNGAWLPTVMAAAGTVL